MNKNEDYGEVEGREPQYETVNGGLTWAALAYTALSILGVFVGILLWQVWINTGRLDRVETGMINHEKEMARIDKDGQRNDDKLEHRIDQLMTRVDAMQVMCEELRKKMP